MPSYQERLTANNLKIDEITALVNTLPDADEINEKIDAQDTIIENLKSALDDKAGLGGGTPNIFVQTDEPTTKKGIWLKKEAEPEHYTYDEEIFIGGEWMADGTHENLPYSLNSGSAVTIGTNIYLLGGRASPYNQNYKYDTLTDTYTQLTNIPYQFYDGSAAAVGTDIYLFGGVSNKTNNYKYDTLTDTYTQLTNIPYNFIQGVAATVGTNIYLFGSSQNTTTEQYAYKYDTLTDTYTKLTNTPYRIFDGAATTIGTNIYILGTYYNDWDKYNYKYDTLTNTYTKLANIPYRFKKGAAVSIGTDIYIFGGSEGGTNAYKYDTLTNTYTQLVNIPYNFSYYGNKTPAVSVGTDAYLLGDGQKVQVYIAESKTYQQDNLVVISQGKYSNAGYEIELYNNSKDVTSPKYAFADAWYYTTEGGLETDIPTYYGDGTQWINIKNPPLNS